jgi:hypothetical protein
LNFGSSACGFSANECSISGVLTKDFRYAFFGELQDATSYVRVWLMVQSPFHDQTPMNELCTETCDVEGCRNTDLFRSPYLCQPSPSCSLSHSPSPTPSFVFSGSDSLTHFTSSPSFTFSFNGRRCRVVSPSFSLFFFACF